MSSSTSIVGGGIGGFTLAQELRKAGYTDSIAIIDEHGFPYDRPPLSKEVLNGTKTAEEIRFVPDSWYEDNNVEVIQAKVERVNTDTNTLVLGDGSERPYDKLVLATGGHARRINGPGFFHDSVIVLRTLEDAQKLSKALVPDARVGIVGAGLIGAEVASAARDRGAKVILVDPAPVSLVPAVGIEIAERLHALHETNGVEFVNGMITAINHHDDGRHTLEVDGQGSIDVDHVLLCIGLVPDESLADSAELDVDGGVLVDREQRTSAKNIWAIGDCSRVRNADGSLERRHEHWDAAVQDATRAAASIAGTEPPQESADWFWSDRYGIHVEGAGSMVAEGTTVVRRNADGEPEVAFRVTPERKLAGAAVFDDSKAIRAARRIIDRNISVDPAQLVDPAVSLKKLTR
ncbi:NAD(P)/FAD-dependent oxidoreductase [Corynebacterium lubricantis]|uniref:NAD(P)/FAD-dependent oxidoreductase n=1 Tax=Corynebacterium lubricantis TaxID=541095 RepID=UPI00037C855B|nr:FAD-dependent oxidoreductase [Corynebacterium lubricantis]